MKEESIKAKSKTNKESEAKKVVKKSSNKTSTKSNVSKKTTPSKTKATKTTTTKKEEPKKLTKEELQKKENVKAYKILSYIGILWIIGLLVPQKDNEELKFHVGQGIILSIAEVVLAFIINIINSAVVANIFRQEVFYNKYPTGLYTTTFFGSTIMSILNLCVIAIIIYLVVIGITNVLKDQQKELPIIGKYSFYK